MFCVFLFKSPNITGRVVTPNVPLFMTSTFNGAFLGNSYSTDAPAGQTGTVVNSNLLQLDASRSSAIYGASSTVQPKSRQALMIIKA